MAAFERRAAIVGRLDEKRRRAAEAEEAAEEDAPAFRQQMAQTQEVISFHPLFIFLSSL